MNAQADPLRPLDTAAARTSDTDNLLLAMRGVSKRYGSGNNANPVLCELDLEVRSGEFVAIVGFSGSGKTTLISLLAGLIEPDEGDIEINGSPVRGPGPDRGVVFQSYSLLPWGTVLDNVQLAVDAVFRKESRSARRERALRYIELVNLQAAVDKRPAELSGGMRQRVAVARALSTSPEVLLLDEPLSALDALTRGKLQDEILRIWDEERKTVVLITNDVDEAVLMADRVIPMTPGPGARLGPEYVVDLPRPRIRTDLNRDQTFINLRRDITRYLLDAGDGKRRKGQKDGADNVIVLPDIKPNTRLDEAPANPPAAAQMQLRSRTESQLARYVELSSVTKVYPKPSGGEVAVVQGFDLRIKKGEFISLIGHSGCGKSTVLSMLAGLNDISDGGIILDNREIDSAGPDRGIVFQAPSLLPWLTAWQNVELGVDQVFPHATRGERHDIVEYYLTRVGLADAMSRPAADLSNGMKQRVGIARAFALSPKLLLLDEPFGMLDSLTRWELQEVLMEVWQRSQVTAMIVTHDVDEAILLADRVVMMTNGPEARVGKISPVELPRPRTRKALLAHPDYYAYRDSLLTFLAECDHTH